MHDPTRIGPTTILRVTVLVTAGLFVAGSTVSHGDTTSSPQGAPAVPAHNRVTADTLVQGLGGPTGMAFHPVTHELYFAERDAGRVSILRNGKVLPVLEAGFTVDPRVPKWALRGERNQAFWVEPRLRQPTAIALSKENHLFVTEDAPSGRVLEFLPDAGGNYSRARAMPIPWMDKNYSWSSILVADDGRLFLAGSTIQSGPGLHFGTVLMRDLEGEWWVVDYGPFSGFSSLALSRGQDMLVVGDAAGGGVTWWDTERKKVVGASTEPLLNVHGISLLSDGTILALDERQQGPLAPDESLLGPAGTRLLRINPETLETVVLADGLPALNSLLYDEVKGTIYATDTTHGKLESFPAPKRLDGSDYYLRRSLYTYEMAQGLTPKQWPKFMKEFVSSLGVEAGDPNAEEKGEDEEVKDQMVFSLREFADRMPMIAGSVKVVDESLAEKPEKDPVAQIDFVVFYPGQAVVTGRNATPSLSLFSARRASGKMEKTRVLSGLTSRSRSGTGTWRREADEAYLYFPVASCTATRKTDGVNVNLAFLGMGQTEDYYLELECGRVNRGRLMVNGMSGRLADYDVDFTELDDSGEQVRNVMIAGFDPKDDQDYNWLKIGTSPIDSKLNFDEQAAWVPFRLAEYKPLLEKKAAEYRMVRWDDPRPADERTVEAPPGTPTAERDQGPHSPHEPKRAEETGEGHAEIPGTPFEQQALDDEDIYPASWTNLILSRAIETWQTHAF